MLLNLSINYGYIALDCELECQLKRYGCAGTRFQAAGNPVEEKDEVSKHEYQAHCSCYHNCIDSHYCSFCVSWLQLLTILIFSRIVTTYWIVL